MKTYKVDLYYHGYISLNVQAEDEDDAYEIATAKVENMGASEFINTAGIFETDNGVEEL